MYFPSTLYFVVNEFTIWPWMHALCCLFCALMWEWRLRRHIEWNSKCRQLHRLHRHSLHSPACKRLSPNSRPVCRSELYQALRWFLRRGAVDLHLAFLMLAYSRFKVSSPLVLQVTSLVKLDIHIVEISLLWGEQCLLVHAARVNDVISTCHHCRQWSVNSDNNGGWELQMVWPVFNS